MTRNDIYVRPFFRLSCNSSAINVIGLVGNDSRYTRGNWDRNLWIDKQRIGPGNRCGTSVISMASRGMARVLLPDDVIPRIDLYLHKRARRSAHRTGRLIRGAFFEYHREEAAPGQCELDNQGEIPDRVRVALGETEVGSVDCGPRRYANCLDVGYWLGVLRGRPGRDVSGVRKGGREACLRRTLAREYRESVWSPRLDFHVRLLSYHRRVANHLFESRPSGLRLNPGSTGVLRGLYGDWVSFASLFFWCCRLPATVCSPFSRQIC